MVLIKHLVGDLHGPPNAKRQGKYKSLAPLHTHVFHKLNIKFFIIMRFNKTCEDNSLTIWSNQRIEHTCTHIKAYLMMNSTKPLCPHIKVNTGACLGVANTNYIEININIEIQIKKYNSIYYCLSCLCCLYCPCCLFCIDNIDSIDSIDSIGSIDSIDSRQTIINTIIIICISMFTCISI